MGKFTPEQIRDINKGQIIIYQGETPQSVFVIVEGLVRGYNINSQGNQNTISIYGPGDYLPICWVYDISPVATYFYEAMQDTKVKMYDKQTFLSLQQSNFELGYKSLAKSYMAALLHTDALSQVRASDKLAKTLLFLSTQFGKPTRNGFIKIILKLTQSDIGQLSGLTRETVAVELQKLKETSSVIIKSKYYVVNTDKLRAITSEDSPKISLE